MKPNIGQGDRGSTNLFYNENKISKDDINFEVLGSLDELNSFIGFTKSLSSDKELHKLLENVQSSLFEIQSIIASRNSYEFNENKIEWLETVLQKYEKNLEELKNFILPGGSQQASALHVCRTLTRRVERALVSLAKTREVNPYTLSYINRLSDVFFTLTRWLNQKENYKETIWKPHNK